MTNENYEHVISEVPEGLVEVIAAKAYDEHGKEVPNDKKHQEILLPSETTAKPPVDPFK